MSGPAGGAQRVGPRPEKGIEGDGEKWKQENREERRYRDKDGERAEEGKRAQEEGRKDRNEGVKDGGRGRTPTFLSRG